MLFWTHIFDLLAKIALMALTLGLFLLCAPHWHSKEDDPTLFIICFATGIVVWWLLLRPLSSWVHARVRLGASLSWAQARRASMMFSPVRDMRHWHPLWEVRQLPLNSRVAAIEEFMNQMQAEQDAKDARWRAAPALSHFCRWMQWVVVAVSVVLTFANLPPASWVSEFQARNFDGAWYPLLTFLAIALPVSGVFRFLEHATAPREITASLGSTSDDETAASPAPEPQVAPLEEKEKAPDPNDHSRFAPPSR